MQSQALDTGQSIVYDLSVNDIAVSNQGMIEQHLGVNCLGLFKVTRALFPLLLHSKAPSSNAPQWCVAC